MNLLQEPYEMVFHTIAAGKMKMAKRGEDMNEESKNDSSKDDTPFSAILPNMPSAALVG